MPYSSEEGKDWTKRFFGPDKRIDSVLDIGPGAGTYYDLMQPVLQASWWTAIEIWAPYIDQFGLRSKYNEVIIGDAAYVDWDRLGHPDLTLMGDVLEHMTLPMAERIVAAADRISRYVVISIPIIHYPQGTEMGNPYEAHVTHWTDQMVRETLLDGYDLLDYHLGSVVGVYILEGKGGNPFSPKEYRAHLQHGEAEPGCMLCYYRTADKNRTE
jgi:hypothetical protein